MKKTIQSGRIITPKNRIEEKYHSNGGVSSKIPYAKGKKHGMETWWDDRGKKEMERMWHENEIHGVTRWWYENGAKRSEVMHRDGKKHGINTEWRSNGKKWWAEAWVYSKQSGINTWWDKSGRKERETHYLWGKKYAQIDWNEEGYIAKVYFPTLVKKTTPKASSIDKSKIISSPKQI